MFWCIIQPILKAWGERNNVRSMIALTCMQWVLAAVGMFFSSLLVLVSFFLLLFSFLLLPVWRSSITFFPWVVTFCLIFKLAMSRVPSPPPPAEMSSGPVAESWCYTQVRPRCVELCSLRACSTRLVQNKQRVLGFQRTWDLVTLSVVIHHGNEKSLFCGTCVGGCQEELWCSYCCWLFPDSSLVSGGYL